MKKQVLNRVLFFPTCSACGEEFKIRASCVYRNDTKKEIFILAEETNEVFESLMKTGDIKISDVKTAADLVKYAGGCYNGSVSAI
ncbi:CpXC protein [Lachnospiraceae bacterium XBB1006]|nr:CpXC protein [Lachnospiraceae bacterium XBB1006]